MARRLFCLAAGATAVLLGACATLPDDPEERAEVEALNDPLEPTNRAVYDFNTTLDQSIMEPVAEGYRDNLPEWLREAIHNFLANMEEPYTAGNDLLQGNPHAAADALGRFLINSTFGLFGTRDAIAESGGPRYHKTDIGTTLGVWGVPEGPYLMIPFIGPLTLRDGAGRLADVWAHPTGAVMAANGLKAFNMATTGPDLVDTRVELLDPVKEIRRTSLDEYAAIRSLYRQTREAAIAASQSGQIRTGREPPPAPDTPANAGSPAGNNDRATPSGIDGGTGVPTDPDKQPSAVQFVEPTGRR